MSTALKEEKARLAKEIRSLYERELSQPDQAFLAAMQAFAAGVDRAEVQKDLAELGWLGKLDIAESKSADCLWDVRVLLADDAAPPQKQR